MKSLQINDVKISWLGHASFRIEHDGKILYIDPYKIKKGPKADVILSTHGHYDHCSIGDIAKLIKEKTEIFVTTDSTSKISHKIEGGNSHIVKPGETYELDWVKIGTVPAYNINKQFHPRDNLWVGYIMIINGIRIYHAGDTDIIPEMKKIKADIVMVPVGGTYTMDAKQAAEAVNTIMPKLAIPMHYGSIVGTNTDAEKFKQLCKVPVRILD